MRFIRSEKNEESTDPFYISTEVFFPLLTGADFSGCGFSEGFGARYALGERMFPNGKGGDSELFTAML
jgi:hypothetical protein